MKAYWHCTRLTHCELQWKHTSSSADDWDFTASSSNRPMARLLVQRKLSDDDRSKRSRRPDELDKEGEDSSSPSTSEGSAAKFSTCSSYTLRARSSPQEDQQ